MVLATLHFLFPNPLYKCRQVGPSDGQFDGRSVQGHTVADITCHIVNRHDIRLVDSEELLFGKHLKNGFQAHARQHVSFLPTVNLRVVFHSLHIKDVVCFTVMLSFVCTAFFMAMRRKALLSATSKRS